MDSNVKKDIKDTILFLVIIAIIIALIVIFLKGQTSNTSSDNLRIKFEDLYKNSPAQTYYYEQLSNPSREIYAMLAMNIDKLKRGEEITYVAHESKTGPVKNFQEVWDAFKADRPDVFYINPQNLSLYSKVSKIGSNIKEVKYTLKPIDNKNTYLKQEWADPGRIDSALSELEGIAERIKNKLQGESVATKVRAVHNYIVDNSQYSVHNTSDTTTIYDVLVNKSGTCEGFADSFKYLMDALNIETVNVYGTGETDSQIQYHAWNYVKMPDNRWYAVDVTWDNPILINTSSVPQSVKEKYLLVGASKLFSDHKEDGDISGKKAHIFKYPKLYDYDYN